MVDTRREHAGGAVQTTITAGITAASTSITISSATGWSSGTNGPFFVVIDAGTASEEKVLIQTRTGTTLTVAASGRGVDGTGAASHDPPAAIYQCGPVALECDEWSLHCASTSAVHGVTGNVVGTSDTQTLSAKTLNTPTIGDYSNATHTHAASGSGGLLATAAPTASAVGDASVTGTATTYARTDHKHAREAFAAPGNSAVGDAAAAGAAATVARSDHTHGREAFGGSVVSETTYGLSATVGAATTVARSDHSHGSPPALKEVLFARKTADEGVTSSTVMQDDNHLTLTVSANKVYRFECVLRTDGAATGDISYQFVGPAGSTMMAAGHDISTTGTTIADDRLFDVFLSSSLGQGTFGAGSITMVHVSGVLVVAGTGGTFKVQWAQQTSNGTASQVLTNSFIELREVA